MESLCTARFAKRNSTRLRTALAGGLSHPTANVVPSRTVLPSGPLVPGHQHACRRRAEDLGGHMEALLLKPEEVAECLNVNRSKVYELMRSGALESVRIGARRRVPRTAVNAFIEHLREHTVAS